MDYFRTEIKAGMMIVISAVILLILVFYVGGFNVLEDRYPVRVRFNFTGGLDKSAPVRFAGVKVGEVKDIRLLSKEKEDANIEILLSINPKVELRKDSHAFINTLGFMGEKYVELTPGTIESPIIKPGDMIIGTDPIQMDELLKKGQKIADELEKAIGSLQKFLDDADDLVVSNREDVRQIVINLKETSEHAKEFAKTIEENPWKIIWKSKEKKTTDDAENGEPASRKKKEPLRRRRQSR